MKYKVMLLILVGLPLILAANIFDVNTPHLNKFPLPQKYADRTWRINEILEDNFTGSGWESQGTYFYIYSPEYPTRLDTLKYCIWDTNNEAWVPVSVQSITYDATNEYVVHTAQSVNQGMGLMDFARGNFEYDAQNRLTWAAYEFYNGDLMEWLMAFRVQIFYNSNTDYAVHNYQLGEDGGPAVWSRQEFTWDTQGRIATETRTVSADSVTWNLDTYSTMTYDPDDTTNGDTFVSNVAHYLPFQQMFDMIDNWNFLGMETEEVRQSWTGVDWANHERTLWTYNNDDLLEETIEQVWNTDIWTNNDDALFTYDLNNNLDQKIESYWSGADWIPSARLTLTWGQDVGNDDNTIPAVSALNLDVYPNPFREGISLRAESKSVQPLIISIYNLKGQLVKTITGQTNTAYNWDGKDNRSESVSDGVYFIRIKSAEQELTAKVLKIK